MESMREPEKVGVVVTEDMTLYVGAITTVYVLEGIEFPVPEEGIIKLESNEMKVLVGESFPRYLYLSESGRRVFDGNRSNCWE